MDHTTAGRFKLLTSIDSFPTPDSRYAIRAIYLPESYLEACEALLWWPQNRAKLPQHYVDDLNKFSSL